VELHGVPPQASGMVARLAARRTALK